MVSRSALLRNIRPSGGLFTENIILRLRDNPDQLKIGKIESFIEKDTKELRKNFKEKKKIIFEWCTQKWDEISPNIENWSLNDLSKKWLIPLFTLFGHDIEIFNINEENIDDDSPLRDFKISHQSKDHKNPFFHFVNINEDFDSKIEYNPQGKPHHNTCQQFINFNPEIKWLFLSNGRILRILTKYYHSYSKGYLEFDLENIFANRDVKEFNVLYSIIHSSRFIEQPKAYKFLIDLFQKESLSEGVKIGDALRDNVKKALVLLGNELIQQNLDFLDKILSGEIDRSEFYAELLRVIYRIIFILYAEQRNMLPGAGTLYFEQFSLSSLRFLVEKPIKAEKNYDLWNKLFITFSIVNEGNEFLDVNSYNGSLFKNENLSIILKNNLKVSNSILLKIIRSLTTSIVIKVRQRINFLEITEEEIGAIYESLLDYKPNVSKNAQFQLIEGTERKSTGSYYTPKALIDILIRTTLQPLVEYRLNRAGDNKKDREKAILDLKICDPACGGGTFLLAALDFLGKKLAEIKTDFISPSEDDLREARRQILQHCIYGVDMNPLAVELAKISLWLRACVKDKPLNFLDNHIKCGNSLIGLGQKMEIYSINPDAFEAISGNKATGIPPENKKLKNKAREIIRNEIKESEKQGKKTLITSFLTEEKTADICSTKFQEIIDLPETDPQKIEEKENRYYKLKKNENYLQALDEANIWTSTFFWPFEGDTLGEIPRYTTIEQLRDNVKDPELNKLMKNIDEITRNNQFFHWYVEFPEVFSSERGGFDCILMNPPWNILMLNEEEFLTRYFDRKVDFRSKKRTQFIKSLKEEKPKLFLKYRYEIIKFEKLKNYFKNSYFYPNTAIGSLDLYPLFFERSFKLINNKGTLGIICPIGILHSYLDMFNIILKSNKLNECIGFINTKKIFPSVANHKQFLLLSLYPKGNKKTKFMFDLEETSDYFSSKDFFNIESKDFEMINPNSKTPIFVKNQYEFDLIKKAYKNGICNLKNIKSDNIIHRMFHGSDDRKNGILFRKDELINEGFSLKDNMQMVKEKMIYLPVYEGKLIFQYDFLYGSYENMEMKDRYKRRAKCKVNNNKDIILCEPRYWCEQKEFLKKISDWNHSEKWFLSYRDATGPKNERTMVFSIIPLVPTLGTLNNFINITSKKALYYISHFNSILLDYIYRKKMATNHLKQKDIAQLPLLKEDDFQEVYSILKPILLELIYFGKSLKNFAESLDFHDIPYKWSYERRIELKSQIDAVIFLKFGFNKEEIDFILNDFHVLKNKEIEIFKDFRSKIKILEYYDYYKGKIQFNED